MYDFDTVIEMLPSSFSVAPPKKKNQWLSKKTFDNMRRKNERERERAKWLTGLQRTDGEIG